MNCVLSQTLILCMHLQYLRLFMSKWLIWTLLEMSVFFVFSSLILLWLTSRLKKKVDKRKVSFNKQAEKNLTGVLASPAHSSINNTAPNDDDENNFTKPLMSTSDFEAKNTTLQEVNHVAALEVYEDELTQIIKRLVDIECLVEEKKSSNAHLMIALEQRRILGENAGIVKTEISTLKRQNQQLKSAITKGGSQKNEVVAIKGLVDKQVSMTVLLHNKTDLHNRLFESESRQINLEKITTASALLAKNIDRLNEDLIAPTKSLVEISTS